MSPEVGEMWIAAIPAGTAGAMATLYLVSPTRDPAFDEYHGSWFVRCDYRNIDNGLFGEGILKIEWLRLRVGRVA